MRFQVYTPAGPLNRFVDRFYAPVAPSPYQREYVMPAPSMDLKVNFGDPVEALSPDGGDWAALAEGGWGMGIWERHHGVCWATNLDFVGVSLKPAGLFALFGIEGFEVRNKIIALDDLFGGFSNELRERLFEAPDINSRFLLLDRLLTARIRLRRETLRIEPALRLLKERRGIVRVSELVSAAEVSHKHLVSLFKSVVGVPPKTLARIYRLERVLCVLDTEGPGSWADVAHDFAYSDQSHFNRDFKRLTGHCPGGFAEKRRQARAAIPRYGNHPRCVPLG